MNRSRPCRAAVFALAVGVAAGLHAGAAEGAEATPARPLRLGIVAARQPDVAIERVEAFRLRLADTLGVDVRTLRYVDERALIDAFATGRVDYGPLSAAGYAMAWRLCGCVEPLAVPRAADGSAGWRVVVVARTGGPIEKPADLAGRRLAVGREDSLGARRLPTMLLARDGLGAAGGPRPVPTDGPRSAVKAVLAGDADAAVVWSTLEGDVSEGYGRGTLHDMVATGDLAMTELRVVWSSPVLPHGPQVVRSDLPEGPKRRLRDMLVDLDEVDPDAYDAIEPVYGGGFLRIGAAAYRPFVDLVTPRPEPEGSSGTTGTTPPTGRIGR